jgi:Outer membrane protein and related peptidoglycan-associated (lipo)proteins
MKTRNILLIILSFTAVSGLFSQTSYLGDIRIENQKTVKENGHLAISMDIVLDELKMKSNDLMILTPVLQSNKGIGAMDLPTVLVAGNKRMKVLERAKRLNNDPGYMRDAQVIVKRDNNTAGQIHYTTALPLSDWMKDASLSLIESVSGCADCDKGLNDLVLVPRIFQEPYAPSFLLTYIMPEAEVKTLSDRHTATFNFVVDRYELLRDYKGNAAKFNEVDKIIGDIRNNPDFEITEFSISGYASPEASVPHNRLLAENRAKSFADYIVSKFGIERSRFKVESFGEDWDGLRKTVAASNLKDRQAILDIIDNVSNPDARDAVLMKLSGGETYRTLLHTYYPPLRRTEYVIAYVVRPFNVEEASEIIKTDPRQLSLNEIYLVAQSYPVDSDEFSEVFDIAVRLYPDSHIAILNSAAADIEGGNMDAAINRMMRIGDNPKVWNNLGVAYALKGDVAMAEEYFKKASAQGDEDAKANLLELRK